MDGYKKFKKDPRKTSSIDGFMPSSGNLGAPAHRAYKLSDDKLSPSLGSFTKKNEGFHPFRSGGLPISDTTEADEAALLEEPIILDDSSSKKKIYKHPRVRTILKRTSLVLIILVLIGGLYFATKLYITKRHVFHGGGGAPALASSIDISQLKGEGDGRINILLLGIGGPGHDGPDLTDTILLASIDPINHKAALLSIPRDLWVKIPGNGYQKINAAYPDGKQESKAKTLAGQEQDGLNLLDQTLESVIGVPIHYHVVVDFAAFKQTVDTLGGVNINVTSDELNWPSANPTELYDPTIAWENNDNSIIAKEGSQVMHGQQALLFSRSRETSSDFARGLRQRAVLVAIKDKILNLGTFSNPVKVSQLLDSLGNNVFTDFSLSDSNRLYQIAKGISSNNITSLDLVTAPHDLVTTGNEGGLSIVEPKAGLFDYSGIQSYVRNTLKDGFIANENAPIAVYNATDTAGLATATGNLLKSYGYNVTTVTNSPTATNPATTTIIDLSKGVDKYTAHYLEQRFGVSAATKMPANSGITPPAGTAFVIILGENATSTGQN